MIGSVRSNIDGSGHIRSRLRAWLAHRRFPVVVSLIAIVLAAPSLLAGWVMDDHIHRSAMVESRFSGLLPGPFDLFNFLDGDAERTAKRYKRCQVVLFYNYHINSAPIPYNSS